ncbi:hypothetical protein IQ266_18910 [filamentous cyanobacterium LEGE 11480]|uniref:Uncharacterized protein n=1 Tax=Romeriopsis navalis LEGE 11480 TaxID=2777977 RepID=A0A928VTJ6_9CYAN|nr:hypothetical protein [Romeriopsis navalis]MBE9031809.1 hypothetical protein [Romeriopsis navalis LEGE 11480]
MRDSTRDRLQTELAELEAAISSIEAQGTFYLQAWVSDSQPSGRAQSYPRVQSRIAQFDGKKIRHIRQGENVAEFVAACDRGQRIGKLRKRADRIAAKLTQTTAQTLVEA